MRSEDGYGAPEERYSAGAWKGYSRKFALRVGLLLYHRLYWLSRCYQVGVAMHTFHTPSSGRKIIVTRRLNEATSSLPTLPSCRSIRTT